MNACSFVHPSSSLFDLFVRSSVCPLVHSSICFFVRLSVPSFAFGIPVRELVSRRFKFKSRSSQHFSVDFGCVRLSWKVSLCVYLWGWFWNLACTLKDFHVYKCRNNKLKSNEQKSNDEDEGVVLPRQDSSQFTTEAAKALRDIIAFCLMMKPVQQSAIRMLQYLFWFA